MSCPKCSSIKLTLAGTYHRKNGRNIQRLECRRCNIRFTYRDASFRKVISSRIRNKIKKLYKTKRPYRNNLRKKGDFPKKDTYSHRDIALMLNMHPTTILRILNEKNNPR